MDLGAFREDPKMVAAVERKLLLISEAATRLGEDAERLCPGLPWHNIRGIGNWLRYRYDSVDVETGVEHRDRRSSAASKAQGGGAGPK